MTAPQAQFCFRRSDKPFALRAVVYEYLVAFPIQYVIRRCAYCLLQSAISYRLFSLFIDLELALLFQLGPISYERGQMTSPQQFLLVVREVRPKVVDEIVSQVVQLFGVIVHEITYKEVV